MGNVCSPMIYGTSPVGVVMIRGEVPVAGLMVERACALRSLLRDFDPNLLSGADAATLVDELALLEKACASAKARAAARAAECGAHREAGFADPAGWLARQSGSSTGAAKAALDTNAALGACPATARALAAGELSLEQAQEIAKAEAVRPGSEAELLEVARNQGLATLRERARKRRHEPIGPEELHRRQRQARSFRHWRNELGNIAFAGQLPPEVGVPFVNRLDTECDRVRREAKKRASANGEQLEGREAYAADALARMVGTSGTRRGTSADAVVVVDLCAWRRGHAHPGEVCHLIGGGTVPVSVAKELANDAFLKAVVHDGVEIKTVKHFGRYRPAELQTALDLGPVPELEGVTCAELGCERRHHLEWDHVNPIANQGPTSFENLRPRCWPHHQEKTERDRAAGLLRGPAP